MEYDALNQIGSSFCERSELVVIDMRADFQIERGGGTPECFGVLGNQRIHDLTGFILHKLLQAREIILVVRQPSVAHPQVRRDMVVNKLYHVLRSSSQPF